MKNVIIVSFLLSNLLQAHSIKEQIDEELKVQVERLDRAISHSEKVEDLQVKEKYRKRLETMKSELQQQSFDYSKESMDHILRLALYDTPPNRLSEIITVHEIEHRPTEFKESVEKLLSKDSLQVEELNNLPYWAKYISDDYQVSVARQIVFHPSAKKLGDSFLTIPSFKDYFESDPKVLEGVLNQLIDQGRIDAGGKIYSWWIKSITEKIPPKSVNTQETKQQEEEISTKEVKDQSLTPWWLIGVIVLLAIVFFVVKGKR